MASPFELELRERLIGYLDGREPLDEFKHWLIGATWDIDSSGDPAAIALVYEIKLALAVHSSGYVSEDRVRRELASLRLPPMPAPTAVSAE